MPIEKIQDVLGHSSPTITKLIYVEVTRQAQRSNAEKLGFCSMPDIGVTLGGQVLPGRTAPRVFLLVGRRQHHANQPATIAGDPLPLRLRRPQRSRRQTDPDT